MQIPLKSILILILSMPWSLLANANINDLKIKLQSVPDSARTELFLKLSKEYRYINIDSALHFANEALLNSKISNEKKKIIKANLELALNHSVKGNFDLSKIYLNKAQDIAIQTNDSVIISEIHSKIGKHYYKTSQYDSAIFYFNKSLEWCENLDLKRTKAINLNGLASIYVERGDLESAVNKYLEAYKIAEELGDNDFKMTLLLNMGTIYTEEGQNSKAIKNYNQVLNLATQAKRNDLLSVVYNNLAIIYSNQNEHEKALTFYEKSLEIRKKIGNKRGVALAHNNLGDHYFTTGNTNKAIDYINQSLDINRKLKLDNEIIYNLETLAQINLSTGNYDKVYTYLKEAIQISKKLKVPNKERDLLKLLAEYYNKTSNYKKAYTTLQEYNLLKDSLINLSRSEKIAQLQTKFETEKKEKENEILRVKHQFTQEKLEQETARRNVLIIFSIVAFALLVLIFILFRSKVYINQRIKKINGMLEESNQKLKVMNVTKDKFFSIIAHDLRSPFNAILGFSELIKDEINTKKDIDLINEYNESVNESAHNLFTLLENLLQWANSQRGELEFSPTQFDLFEIIQSNLTIFSLKASDKSIKLISNIKPNTMVYGDINMINTIVRNLISNALKFTDSNGEIHLSTRIENNFVFLSVKDSGIGISKENQEKLFRLDGNFTTCGTNDETGSGLGLILCKEFVEKNGGNIWVESEINKGSKFVFSLKSA